VHRAVYEQYRPATADDPVPESTTGAVVSVADKLDTVAALLAAGEMPSGSKDPFGLRRAANGVFRIVTERNWPLSLAALAEVAGQKGAVLPFLRDRLQNYLRDQGFTQNEILAVLRPKVSETESGEWPLPDVFARLAAIRTVRGRRDFELLVDLTKRVDNILTKGAEEIGRAEGASKAPWVETEPAAAELEALVNRLAPRARLTSEERRYQETVEIIASFIAPVERFFKEVLVLDPQRPDATAGRARLLGNKVRPLLVTYFDLRELAGQADGGADAVSAIAR
jgi:glycyl-tRNA synthetase beta chain